MLPISVKLLRRLYTWKRFSVLFSLLYVVYSSPKFLFRGLTIRLLSAPPPLSYFIGNLPGAAACKTARIFALAQNARLQAGKGKVWTEGTNGEWVWRLVTLILRKKKLHYFSVYRSSNDEYLCFWFKSSNCCSSSFVTLDLVYIFFCLWFFLEYFSWCGFSSRCS